MLEISGLRISTRSRTRTVEIVRGVDLRIPQSAWVSLVGESGCGKTLTAMSLTRLLPDLEISGKVLWHEEQEVKDLLRASDQDLRAMRGKTIAYIFQDPNTALDPSWTVGDQMVETYLTHYRAKNDEATRAALASLAEVHLSEPRRVFSSYPHELSGGMKQRVIIAMALMLGPRFLVADEPTTSLDVTVERGIIDLLKDIRTEWPFGMLFITHNMDLAAEISDSIYVMRQGRIVEAMHRGEKGFVPTDAYTKALFKAGLTGVPPKTEILLDAS